MVVVVAFQLRGWFAAAVERQRLSWMGWWTRDLFFGPVCAKSFLHCMLLRTHGLTCAVACCAVLVVSCS